MHRAGGRCGACVGGQCRMRPPFAQSRRRTGAARYGYGYGCAVSCAAAANRARLSRTGCAS